MKDNVFSTGIKIEIIRLPIVRVKWDGVHTLRSNNDIFLYTGLHDNQRR